MKKRSIVVLLTFMLMFGLFLVSSIEISTSAASVIDQGTYIGINWVLTDDGTLTLSGTQTANFSSSSAPWIKNYQKQVIKIIDGHNTNGYGLFGYCSNLIKLKSYTATSSFSSANTTTFQNAFANCYLLREINVLKWDVSKANNHDGVRGLFGSCFSIENLDISTWNLDNIDFSSSNFNNGIFDGLYGIRTIKIKTSASFSLPLRSQNTQYEVDNTGTYRTEPLRDSTVHTYTRKVLKDIEKLGSSVTVLKTGYAVNNVLNSFGDDIYTIVRTTQPWANITNSPNIAVDSFTPIYVTTGTKAYTFQNYGTQYIHTGNLNDDGSQRVFPGNITYTGSEYIAKCSSEDMCNKVVKISGATKLHVKLKFGMVSKTLSVIKGEYSGLTADAPNSPNLIQKTSGSSTKDYEFDVEGDTVTFSLTGSLSYNDTDYGYWAEVTGIGTIPSTISDEEKVIWIYSAANTIYANPDCRNMFGNSSFETLDLSWLNTSQVVYMSTMFCQLSNLKTLDISAFDTSKVKYISSMFINCSKLENIKFGSKWNISGVVDLDAMFEGCYELKTLDVSNWNVSNVTSMIATFQNCRKLQNLDVSKWNTSKLQKANGLFEYCYELQSLDVSKWNTSKLEYAYCMFNNCRSLQTLDVSNWDTSRLVWLSKMFSNCWSLRTLNVSNWNVEMAYSTYAMFRNCLELQALDLSNWNLDFVHHRTYGSEFMSSDTGLAYMFQNCQSLQSLNVSKFNTTNLDRNNGYYGFDRVFDGCISLKSLTGLGNWNTSNIISMKGTFSHCEQLKTLDIANWDMSKVTSLSSFLEGCYELQSIDISKWNISNVTSLSYTFSGCKKLTSFNISMFNTSKVKYMEGLFSNCTALRSINLNNIDTSQVIDISFMFALTPNLRTISGLNNFNTQNVKYVVGLFYDSGMESIDISNWDLSKVTNVSVGSSSSAMSSVSYTFCDVNSIKKNSDQLVNGGTSQPAIVLEQRFLQPWFSDMSSTGLFFNCVNLKEIKAPKLMPNITIPIEMNSIYFMWVIDDNNDGYADEFSEKEYVSQYFKVNENISHRYIPVPCIDRFQFTGNIKKLKTSTNSYANTDNYIEKIEWVNTPFTSECELDYTSSSDYIHPRSCGRIYARLNGTTVQLYTSAKRIYSKSYNSLFYRFSKLKSVDLSKLSTAATTDIAYMFDDDSSLEELDMHHFDLSLLTNASSTNNFIRRCNALTKIIAPKTIPAVAVISFPVTSPKKKWYIDDNNDLKSDDNIQYTALKSVNNQSHVYIVLKLSSTLKKGNTVNNAFKALGNVSQLSVVDTPWENLESSTNIALDGETPIYCRKGKVYETIKVHTSNIDDNGVASGSYPYDYDNNRTITIPGASKLHVKLQYGIESTMYDWLAVIKGNYTGSAQDAKSAANVVGIYGNNDDNKVSVTFDVEGDTVTFAFHSDQVVSYYGYYAEVYADNSVSYDTLQLYSVADVICANPDSNSLFKDLSSLTTLDLSWLDTSKVTNMNSMFQNCSGLTSINLNSMDTANVTDMSYMFYRCLNLTALNLSGFNTSNVTDMGDMFHNCSKLTTINVSGWNLSKVTSLHCMFDGCSALNTITGINNWNTGNVTDMEYMFEECSSLRSLNLNNWNVKNVSYLRRMFNGCTSLITLNIDDWKPIKNEIVSAMFKNCSSLITLTLNWGSTPHVGDTDEMFSGCTKLKNLNISGWVPCTDPCYNGVRYNTVCTAGMFADCKALEEIDVSILKIPSTKEIDSTGMFKNCESLRNVVLWDEWLGVNINYMFANCKSLTTIDLSGLVTNRLGYSGSTPIYNMGVDGIFEGCTNIDTIICPKELGINGDDYNVILPYEKMYDWEYPLHGGIKSYNVLPKNASDIITLHKESKDKNIVITSYKSKLPLRKANKFDYYEYALIIVENLYGVNKIDISLPNVWNNTNSYFDKFIHTDNSWNNTIVRNFIEQNMALTPIITRTISKGFTSTEMNQDNLTVLFKTYIDPSYPIGDYIITLRIWTSDTEYETFEIPISITGKISKYESYIH